MRYVLLVEYDGTCFSGYQRQKKGERTVQSELERAAGEFFGVPVRVAASGRTDAGVHARGQVCQFDAETTVPATKLRERRKRLTRTGRMSLPAICRFCPAMPCV